MTEPQRGRYWDERTGNIKSIQQFAKDNINLMDCDALITAINNINVSLQAIQATNVEISISNEASATAQAESNTRLAALATAQATAQAWSESISSAWAYAEIRHMTNIECPRVSPTEPPEAADEPETGITTTPASGSTLCDRIVYIVDFWINFFNLYVSLYRFNTSWSTGIMQAVIGGLLTVTSQKSAGSPLIIPAAIVAAMASEFLKIIYADLPLSLLEELSQALVSQRTEIICYLWDQTDLGTDTLTLQEGIGDLIIGAQYSSPMVTSILQLAFNRSVLAMLYYAPGYIFEVPDAGSECDNLCGV